jgi:hypothetical protein
MKPWLLEHLEASQGWLIDGRYATEDEATYQKRTTPSVYQRRVRLALVNVPIAGGAMRTVESERFRRACGRVSS